jgi:hypothetical protein
MSPELGGVSGFYRRDFGRRKPASTAERIRHEGDQQKGRNAKTRSPDRGYDSRHVTPENDPGVESGCMRVSATHPFRLQLALGVILLQDLGKLEIHGEFCPFKVPSSRFKVGSGFNHRTQRSQRGLAAGSKFRV